MDEAQHLADRVAVMSAGEIIATGRPESSAAATCGPPRSASCCRPAGRSAMFRTFPSLERSIDGDRVLVADDASPSWRPSEITSWALERDIELGHFSVSQPTLEDIYLELTGSSDQQPRRPEEAIR